jgi:hypothetical protein
VIAVLELSCRVQMLVRDSGQLLFLAKTEQIAIEYADIASVDSSQVGI